MKNYLDVILVVSSFFFFLGRACFEVYTYPCNLDGFFFLSFYSDVHICVIFFFVCVSPTNMHGAITHIYDTFGIQFSAFADNCVF